MKEEIQSYIYDLHTKITRELQALDKEAVFKEDKWKMQKGDGGGISRIFEEGNVFEKAGVNFSSIHGKLPEKLAQRLQTSSSDFFATGVSVVIHPKNPMVPTVHCNYRYFEQYDQSGHIIKSWFGGGTDLTPYYIFLEDIIYFHQTLKNACDKHDYRFYPKFKKWCDQYFYLPHRKETRGVGGIFFDYLQEDKTKIFNFFMSVGDAFLEAYVPIVNRRKEVDYRERERDFQRYRRGRYVEFNLLFDRGTLFGIETNGRTESILMSLPSVVYWKYDYKPDATSREAELYRYLQPIAWV